MKDKDINSLNHTRYRCQYHIVFAPKFRRQVDIQRNKGGHRENVETVMSTERDRDNRSGIMSGSYTYL